MKNYKIHFSGIPWEEKQKGFKIKTHNDGQKRIRLIEISKDFVEKEWCCCGHYGFLLEGEMEIQFENKVVKFSQGDGIFIPDGENHKHKGKVITETAKLILLEDA